MELNRKESRPARIERTLAGAGPLLQIGKLLAKTKDGKTLAQRLAEGEEIGRDALDFMHPLPEHFNLSLKSISFWGCPFCGTAHGSGVGVSRSVNVAGLEGNQFYYNPLTQQLFTISTTCLGKQAGLAERFVDSSATDEIQTLLPATADHQKDNSRPVPPGPNAKKRTEREPYWMRKSIAFMVACYCGMVIYSRSLLRTKNS